MGKALEKIEFLTFGTCLMVLTHPKKAYFKKCIFILEGKKWTGILKAYKRHITGI